MASRTPSDIELHQARADKVTGRSTVCLDSRASANPTGTAAAMMIATKMPTRFLFRISGAPNFKSHAADKAPLRTPARRLTGNRVSVVIQSRNKFSQVFSMRAELDGRHSESVENFRLADCVAGVYTGDAFRPMIVGQANCAATGLDCARASRIRNVTLSFCRPGLSIL